MAHLHCWRRWSEEGLVGEDGDSGDGCAGGVRGAERVG